MGIRRPPPGPPTVEPGPSSGRRLSVLPNYSGSAVIGQIAQLQCDGFRGFLDQFERVGVGQ